MNTRNIKFRGKDKDNNWVYGYYYSNPIDCFILPFNWETSERLDAKIIDRKTLGQFTGLKDKNGVEIYEGDIVDWVDSDENKRRDIVKWINGGLVLCNSRYTVGSYPNSKVVGNIHDNPELLTKIGRK